MILLTVRFSVTTCDCVTGCIGSCVRVAQKYVRRYFYIQAFMYLHIYYISRIGSYLFHEIVTRGRSHRLNLTGSPGLPGHIACPDHMVRSRSPQLRRFSGARLRSRNVALIGTERLSSYGRPVV